MPLQQFLARNKKFIEQTFLAVEIALVITILIASGMFLSGQIEFLTLYSVGRRVGQTALIVYLVTLTPGILQRLRIFLPLSAMLSLFRRHFGVLTFLLALSHSFLLVWLPQIERWRFAWPTGFMLMGATALTLLFPMWLTSSDYAQRLLGKWWKRLHRVTYVALFFIFLHVSMQMSDWRWFPLTFLALEVISWTMAWYRLLTTKPQPQPAQPPTQSSPPPVVQ